MPRRQWVIAGLALTGALTAAAAASCGDLTATMTIGGRMAEKGPSLPDGPATISLDRSSGPPGIRVTVHGRNFCYVEVCQPGTKPSPADPPTGEPSAEPSDPEPSDPGGGEGGFAEAEPCAGPVSLYWQEAPGVRTSADPTMTGAITATLPVPDVSSSRITLLSRCRGGRPGPATFFNLVEVNEAGTTTPAERPGQAPPVPPPAPSTHLPTSPTIPPTTPGQLPSAASSSSQPASDAPGQTATARSSPAPAPNTIRLSSVVPTAGEIVRSPAWIGLLGLMLALLFIILMAFPAEWFNSTYQENQGEIRGTVRGAGLGHRRLSPAAALFVFAGAGGVLSAWQAMGEGPTGNPRADAVGLFVALPLVVAAHELPIELYARRHGQPPRPFQLPPPALAVAVLCVVMSLVLNLHPPYLYGLIAGFLALDGDRCRSGLAREAKGVLGGTLCLFALGIIAYGLWNWCHGWTHGLARGELAVTLDALFFWTFMLVGGTLVFALAPVRFLDGFKLARWRRPAWFLPQLAAGLFFARVFVLRYEDGPESVSWTYVVKAGGFFFGFWLFSWLFSAYFRWDGRPTRRFAGPADPDGAGPAGTRPLPARRSLR